MEVGGPGGGKMGRLAESQVPTHTLTRARTLSSGTGNCHLPSRHFESE